MASCKDKEKSVILYNNSFEDTSILARNMHCNFCIVLLDSTQDYSKQYKKRIEKASTETCGIYNLIYINIPEQQWYLKWLCPTSLPLTCVFSRNGTLIDLIPGSTKEALLYTNKAVSEGCTTEFHYINNFDKKKEELIPILDNILYCAINIRQGIFTDDAAIRSIKYPYPYYLQTVGCLLNNDTITAVHAAKKMLAFESPYYLDLYKEEFIVAKKTVDHNFDVSKEPSIRTDKEKIVLNYHNEGETIPFEFTIFNDGERNLDISKIFLSCTCLKLNSIDHFTVLQKDSVTLHLTFHIEQKGKIFRDIFVTSNAINKPIYHIQIEAEETH